MMLSRNSILRIGLVMAVATMPVSALAGHIRAGLWEMKEHLHMPMAAMIPPEQMARMRAMGVQMPTDRTTTISYCVSAADAANDKPPPVHNRDCAMSNMIYTARTFSANMVCVGSEMQGQGHVSVSFDGDQHYSGSYAANMSVGGRTADISNSFEARWISADCGDVK
jgi:hypothetical protein